ncbi:unnamed protein product [Toxocara canis]|uniref:F-box domain-containing protein n=1 Tax=Toxocara canis TaxID=6265 RepID=A0A183V3M5_TOXCA|nr:unnamed protein product [Toxocara canis]
MSRRSRIFDYCTPYDLIKWKQVCKHWNELISDRFENILYLDVYRLDMHVLLNQLDEEDGKLFEHPSAQILIQLNQRSATIIVHDKWTSKDVHKVFEAIRMFGRTAHTVMIDACIAELMIAGLSSMDLGRWYAFQCYLRSLNGSTQEDNVHAHCVRCNTQRILLPNLKELTVRVSVNEYPCLSRLMDYGVSPEAIFDVEQLQLFRLCLPCIEKELSRSEIAFCKRRYSRHIRTFKSWIDAQALQERYCQQYL